MKTITIGAMFAVAAWGSAQSPVPITVTVDGRPLEMATAPREERSRVLVPMREVFRSLDADVDYDPASKMVTGKKVGHKTTLSVGSTKATIDGRDMTMPTAVKPIDGVIMVPLRFVAESLGAKVDYVAAQRLVKIEKPTKEASPSAGSPDQSVSSGGEATAMRQNREPSSGNMGGNASSGSQWGQTDTTSGSAMGQTEPSQGTTGTPDAGTVGTGSGTNAMPHDGTSMGSADGAGHDVTPPVAATTGTTSTPGAENPDATTNAGTETNATAGTVAPATPVPDRSAARPTTASVAQTEAQADSGFDFMRLLPWLLGALALGALAYFVMASRARQGGVIASDTDQKTPRA